MIVILSTVVTALGTAAIAALTFGLVRVGRMQVRAHREVLQPRLLIYPARVGETTVDVVIENVGGSSAFDIRIEVDDQLVGWNGEPVNLPSKLPTRMMLAPGQCAVVYWTEDPASFKEPPELSSFVPVTCRATFSDQIGGDRFYSADSLLDLRNFRIFRGLESPNLSGLKSELHAIRRHTGETAAQARDGSFAVLG